MSRVHHDQLHQSNLTSSLVTRSVAGWVQEVITPVMIALSCLVLCIAAIILILLVKHYKYETNNSVTVTQVRIIRGKIPSKQTIFIEDNKYDEPKLLK